MFNDVGPLEIVALVILAVIVFGPEKLPRMIQDAARFIRKVREFSDNAKQDIRNELGPEFKDFDFEDLNPRTFVRKQLENDELGIKELRNSFDLRKEIKEISDAADLKDVNKEMAGVADAVNGRDSVPAGDASPAALGAANGSVNGSGTTPDLLKKQDKPDAGDPPPFDADAT